MFRFPLIIRIVLIAAVGIGALVFRDRVSGGAGDLKVGDCFDNPSSMLEVRDVQHHPCTEPHTSEVVYVGDVPDGASYPTDGQFSGYASDACVPSFDRYTGLDFMTFPALDMGYFVPTADGWASGDRSLICYAVRVDGTTVSQSLEAGS